MTLTSGSKSHNNMYTNHHSGPQSEVYKDILYFLHVCKIMLCVNAVRNVLQKNCYFTIQ